MKTLVYLGPRRLEIREADIPVPAPGEAVLKVEAVGICGSELEGYLGHSAVRTPPLVMGHEFCGVIESLAPDVEGWNIGDKVVVNPLIACGTCDRCRQGRENICRSRRIVGIHRPGAFADYVAVPAANMIRVPADFDAAAASLAEPLAVCVHALRIGFRPLEDLVIFGAGPIGLLTLQAAQAMGAGRVLVVERQPARLQFARQLGAETASPAEAEEAARRLFGARGVDTIVDCVGVEATRAQSIALVNPGGVIGEVGLGADYSNLPMNHVVRQEISLIGSYTYSSAEFGQAVDLLLGGKVTRERWSAGCGLEEAGDVFERLVNGTADYGKYIIHP